MQTISIANQKGGVGKTTLSCLLAFYLAEKRRARVAAIDVDGQGNLSWSLRDYAVDVPAMALFDDEAVRVQQVRSPICLFPATQRLNNLEIGSAEQQRRRVDTFAAHVQSLSGHFDYCLIDPPPTPGMRTVATLAAADYVAIPIELEEYSREGVKRMIQMIHGVRSQYNPRLKFVGILPNRVMKTQPRQRHALVDLFTHYSAYLLPGHVAVSARSAIPRALEEGKPVWRLAGAREASTEVLRAFDALMATIEASSEAALTTHGEDA